MFLTGFMGSGKTTIGRLLSKKLGFRFHDLDQAIEKAAGKPITDIFQDDGEAVFRQYERQALEAATARRYTVVALGGGALIAEENRTLVKQAGPLIYLRSTVETVYDRVKHRTHRPLLLDEYGQVVSRECFEQRIQPLFEERKSGYDAADIVVDTDDLEVDKIVDSIIDALHLL